MYAARSWLMLPAAAMLGPMAGTHGAEMGTAFTYQGQLDFNGSPVDDSCDFEFTLWDDPWAGSQKGPTLLPTLPVDDGLFATNLDFGEEFNGDARWLELAVKCSGDDDFITLSPRQELTPTPYAIYAETTGIKCGWYWW